jgi:metal-responsive CopG/Arc/MetJ family transcriptional regulator
MIRTQIQLPDELAVHIKEAAAREHVSMAEMIRRAVARFMETAAKAGTGDSYGPAAGISRFGTMPPSRRPPADELLC